MAIEAADILDEACEEESFLKALVLQQPQLLHLGEKGAAIQTRYFSVKRGFALMSRLGYLEAVQERWSKVGKGVAICGFYGQVQKTHCPYFCVCVCNGCIKGSRYCSIIFLTAKIIFFVSLSTSCMSTLWKRN